ncbi:MAG: hypothetical protein ACRD01_09715 [Terriglobales bacterium]
MSFEINLGPLSDGLCGICIRFAGTTLTRLIRKGEDKYTEYLNAPPAALADWLLHNWWRLRFEAFPPGPQDKPLGELPTAWRLAHDLRSIDEGYRWPEAVIWGQGEHALASAEPDPIGVTAPVRYVANTSKSEVQAAEFERGVDAFLDQLGSIGNLQEQVLALRNERSNPEFAAWRRLEAKLGFDPDAAPDELIEKLADLGKTYGEANIEETAAAAPGLGASNVLQAQIDQARSNVAWECRFAEAPTFPAELDAPSSRQWERAETTAAAVRNVIGVDDVLDDRQLADLCEVQVEAFSQHPATKVPFGIRLREPQQEAHRVVVRSRWREGRRFQFARAFGDHLFIQDSMEGGSLGPIADSTTARQQFQRAFGAALLCPIENLRRFLPVEVPNQDDIEEAAKHFEVSPMLVKSTLQNHKIPLEA